MATFLLVLTALFFSLGVFDVDANTSRQLDSPMTGVMTKCSDVYIKLNRLESATVRLEGSMDLIAKQIIVLTKELTELQAEEASHLSSQRDVTERMAIWFGDLRREVRRESAELKTRIERQSTSTDARIVELSRHLQSDLGNKPDIVEAAQRDACRSLGDTNTTTQPGAAEILTSIEHLQQSHTNTTQLILGQLQLMQCDSPAPRHARRIIFPDEVKVPKDCLEILRNGNKTSGKHVIQRPQSDCADTTETLEVFCDQDTDGGGWTVFQSRGNFNDSEIFFNRNWKEYKDGFGNFSTQFWLGNDAIHTITACGDQELRIDLGDFGGHFRYAKYNKFHLGSEEEDFQLSLENYSGTAGDSLLSGHNGLKFSTYDRDNDGSAGNCAQHWTGGWWFNHCFQSNLNGKYRTNPEDPSHYGPIWESWRGLQYPLETTKMMMRPS